MTPTDARRGGGAPAPLFDRLTDVDLREHPIRDLDREGLRLSVLREVSRLLNTRAPDADLDPNLGAPAYGVREMTAWRPGDPVSRAGLGEDLRARIEAFEPRLRNVSVIAHLADASTRARFRAEWEARALRSTVNRSLANEGLWADPLPSTDEPGALILDISGDLLVAGAQPERIAFSIFRSEAD